MAVLNLNNMRDIENDAQAGKNPSGRMGIKGQKVYHAALLVLGMATAIGYSPFSGWNRLALVVPYGVPSPSVEPETVFQNKEPRKLDGELKKVALSTFLFAILFALFP